MFDAAWRIDNDVARFLDTYLFWARPKTIVEFGSGASTLLFAEYAAQATINDMEKVRVVSYEQDAGYAANTQKALALEALYAQVVHAPIFDGWYDRFRVAGTLPETIDLVLVDGPGPCLGRTREPAMEWVYPRLSRTGLVVLDDGRRDMERLYVKHWQEQYPDLDVKYLDTPHGAYLIRKG